MAVVTSSSSLTLLFLLCLEDFFAFFSAFSEADDAVDADESLAEESERERLLDLPMLALSGCW